MATNVNNFAIDHVLRGVMVDGDGDYMWSINQITDPSLSITSETAEVVDALGTQIVEYNRGKNAEFTANNSLFDLGLYAAQNGTEVIGAGTTTIAPTFQTIDLAANATTLTLAQTPVDGTLKAIYVLNGDGTMGAKYSYTTSATPSATEFKYAGKNVTLGATPSATAKTQVFAMYDYETTNATSVVGTAVEFPKAGRFIMEVLGTDVCDPTTQIHAYVEFPNAKLDANVDVSFTTDGNHPFTIRAMQAYCDTEKKLFRIIIPVED